MKFAAVCVTEGRPDLYALALASFFTQHLDVGDQAVLYTEVAGNRFKDYEDTLVRFAGFIGTAQRRVVLTAGGRSGPEAVPERFQRAFRLCSDAFHSDAFLMWDDDDWQPCERLLLTKEALSRPGTHICGYQKGFFVNIRTLRGEPVEISPDYYWGGSLGFDRRALAAADFSAFKNPGYDGEFTQAVKAHCGPQPCGEVLDQAPWPVAFSHGKNIATFLASPGDDMTAHLKRELPHLVWCEVERLQQLCIEKRIYPPQPPGEGAVVRRREP